jgi:hypothetical protein
MATLHREEIISLNSLPAASSSPKLFTTLPGLGNAYAGKTFSADAKYHIVRKSKRTIDGRPQLCQSPLPDVLIDVFSFKMGSSPEEVENAIT